MSSSSTGSRGASTSASGRWVAPVVVAVVALFVSALAFQTATTESLRHAEADHRREVMTLAVSIADVERVVSEEVAQRQLAGWDDVSLVRSRSLEVATSSLAELAEGRGETAVAAAAVAQQLLALGDVGSADTSDLVEFLQVIEAPSFTTGHAGVDDAVAASAHVTIAHRLLLGALSAHGVGPHADPVSLADRAVLVERAVAAPSTLPALAPGVTSPLFDQLDLVLDEHGQPDVYADVVAVDRGELPTPSIEPAALVAQGLAAAAALDGIWAAAFDDVGAELTAAVTDAELRRQRFRIAGWALLAGAVVSILAAAASRMRRRPLPDSPAANPSTGTLTMHGFRRRADQIVGGHDMVQHLVGVVRIDRIEMLADGYGNDGVERVERLVASRLRRAAAWLCNERGDTEVLVGRRGPGDFVVSVHSRRCIDLDLVRRVLLLRAGTAIPLGDDHVPVTYSVGLTLQLGAPDIDGALVAAERALREHPPLIERAPQAVEHPLHLAKP